MSDRNNQGFNRAEVRKEKKKNMILNIAIGVVALLIVVVSASMFIGGDDEPAAVDNQNEEENVMANENEQDMNEPENNAENDAEETDAVNHSDEGTEDAVENDGSGNGAANIDDGSSNEAEESANGNEDSATETTEVTEGDWGPIGTVQEEPFTAVYDRDHVNWDEMTRALEYAMNRSEDELIIEWLGNGGDHQTAEGTVSLRENRSQAYQITLSWVENEGWMPVTKEELSTNPYQ